MITLFFDGSKTMNHLDNVRTRNDVPELSGLSKYNIILFNFSFINIDVYRLG